MSVTRAAEGVLLFAVVYLPLEEFLLRWAPGGAAGYLVLRAAFELLLAGALLALVAGHLVRARGLARTPLDLALAAFVGLALASLALSGGAWLAGLVNLRVLLRFVPVYYLAVWLAPGPRARRRLLVLVLASAGAQCLLGLLQRAQGGVRELWLPRAARFEAGGFSREFAALGGLEQGAVLGTTDHSVGFALLVLVGATLSAALWLAGAGSRRGRLALAALVTLAPVVILASFSRATLFAFGLVMLALALFARGRPELRRLAPAALVLTPLFAAAALLGNDGRAGGGPVKEKETRVTPFASVEALFTREYLATAEASRLWVLAAVGAEVVRSAGWLGLGPDEDHAKRELARAGGARLHRLLAYRAFEDVYWVALLAYYGVLGLAAFAWVLACLAPAAWRVARAPDAWERALGWSVVCLLGVLVPLSFLAPTLDFRTFSFYFWLLAGVAAAPRAIALSSNP
jgi:hypothetical protein